MADLISNLPRVGLSVILIEHNLPQVERICPTLYVQSNGRQLAFGVTNDVMADPAVRQAYLGVGPRDVADQGFVLWIWRHDCYSR